MFKLFRRGKKAPLTNSEVVAYAVKERAEAMDIFIQSKNRMVLANETIGITQESVKEAMVDLQETERLLEENKAFNDKFIKNIDAIIE